MVVGTRISEIGMRAINTVRTGVGPLVNSSIRIASAIGLASNLGFSIPVMAAAFGASACGGYTEDIKSGVPCKSTPDINLINIQTKFNSDTAIIIDANGKSSVIVTMNVKSAQGAEYAGAQVSFTLGTNNLYKFGANGKLGLCASADDCAPCTDTVIDNCNPAHDENTKIAFGLIPMGDPLRNAEGALMFQEANGPRWAVAAQAYDFTFGEKVYVYDYTDSQTDKPITIMVGRRHYVDWGTGEATDKYRWYQVGDDYKCVGAIGTDAAGQTTCGTEDKVSPNGVAINDDNPAVYDKKTNQILLPAKIKMFETDDKGAYKSTQKVNVNGVDVTVPISDDKLFQVFWTQPIVDAPSSHAVYFGQADNQGGYTPWGLLRDKDQKISYSQLGQYVRNMQITRVEIVNLAAGSAGDTETIDLSSSPKPLIDINDPLAFNSLVPPRFYAFENPNFQIKLYLSEPDGAGGWMNSFDLVRAANIVPVVSVFKQGNTCE